MKKAIIFLMMVNFSGCVFYAGEEELVPCGYEKEPYTHLPEYCDVNSYTYDGECCTWRVQDFYAECQETWCYRENMCSWRLDRYTCYPI